MGDELARAYERPDKGIVNIPPFNRGSVGAEQQEGILVRVKNGEIASEYNCGPLGGVCQVLQRSWLHREILIKGSPRF
jgi:hypothetical protein